MIPSVNPSAQLFLADVSRMQSQIDHGDSARSLPA